MLLTRAGRLTAFETLIENLGKSLTDEMLEKEQRVEIQKEQRVKLACASREDGRSRMWRSVEFPDASAGSIGAEHHDLGGAAGLEVDSSVEPARDDIPPKTRSGA